MENAKNQWEATFDAITDWIFIIDKNFNIVRSNKASGKLFGLLPQNIVVKDITDRKTSEQKVLVARKAEAFRILAGGLAHDYNNLLTTIWGNISLLQDEIKDPIQQELLEETETACKVARSLTHKFLSLSKRKILNKSQCDIEQVLSLAVQNSLKPGNVKNV